MPQPICLITTRVAARIVVRTVAPWWPLLVVDECEYDPTHSHVHTMLTPLPVVKVAPCCRRPYLLEAAAA
jgi:hypothetical protein